MRPTGIRLFHDYYTMLYYTILSMQSQLPRPVVTWRAVWGGRPTDTRLVKDEYTILYMTSPRPRPAVARRAVRGGRPTVTRLLLYTRLLQDYYKTTTPRRYYYRRAVKRAMSAASFRLGGRDTLLVTAFNFDDIDWAPLSLV